MPCGSTSVDRRRAAPWLAALAFAWAVGAGDVEAQAPNAKTARVRALFDEGIALVDRGRWAEAEARFRECLAIRRSPVIEYNLASTLEVQGELAEAASFFRGVVARRDAPPDLVSASKERLAELESSGDQHGAVLASTAPQTSVSLARAPTPEETAELSQEPAPIRANTAPTTRTARERPLLWIALSTAVVGVVIAGAFLAGGDDANTNVDSSTRGLVTIGFDRGHDAHAQRAP